MADRSIGASLFAPDGLKALVLAAGGFEAVEARLTALRMRSSTLTSAALLSEVCKILRAPDEICSASIVELVTTIGPDVCFTSNRMAGTLWLFMSTHMRGLKATINACLLYTSPSPRDGLLSRMPSSA